MPSSLMRRVLKYSSTRDTVFEKVEIYRNAKHTRFQIVPVEELSKNVPVTFLNVFILFANKLRSNGCERARFILERRVFDSSAKSSTSINVIPTFHEEELRFCVCHAPGRMTDANRTLIIRKTEAIYRRTQMRRERSDRLFLSSTVYVFQLTPLIISSTYAT